jgi:hypothetical protein
MPSCIQCRQPLKITDKDLAFYEKVSPVFSRKKELIPPPARCPQCRQQRRLSWRNERYLFRRSCSATGTLIVSIHPPTVPFPVYAQNHWWSDAWDPKAFGRPYDPQRGFFAQLEDLMRVVPKIAMLSMSNENSEFVNLSSWNKDCYLLFESDNNRDCMHCDHSFFNEDCVDVSYTERSKHCYECLYCKTCYSCRHSAFCENCTDCHSCRYCIGCSDCFGCINLRNKRFCFFNQQCTEEEYLSKKTAFQTGTVSGISRMLRESESVFGPAPRKCVDGTQNESCSGNCIWNSNDCRSCFDVRNLRDCTYVCNCENSRDCMDIDMYGGERGMEQVYEGHSVGNGDFRCSFNTCLFEDAMETYYSDFCMSCDHLFGCVSVRRAKYCVLNKQYSENEYNDLVPKIIERMRVDGEWGEFFPSSMSSCAYDHSVADEYYPLSRQEAEKTGFRWSDYNSPPPDVTRVIGAAQLPEAIAGIPDDILNWAVTCEATAKPFRIVKKELDFYRSHNLPVPHLHPDERYMRRMALRNPRRLWNRQCAKCSKTIHISYSPERSERVYCEDCYLKEVY